MTHSMFAEISSTTPVGIAAWLACAAFLIGLINGGMKLVDRAKDRPHPGDVRAEAVDRFATKTEVKDLREGNEAQHRDIFAKMGGIERGVTARIEARLSEMQRDSNEGRDKLHDRINEVLAVVSELRGTVNELKR